MAVQYLGWIVQSADGSAFLKFVGGTLPQWGTQGRGRILSSDEARALVAKLKALGFEATASQVGLLDGDVALGEG